MNKPSNFITNVTSIGEGLWLQSSEKQTDRHTDEMPKARVITSTSALTISVQIVRVNK